MIDESGHPKLSKPWPGKQDGTVAEDGGMSFCRDPSAV